MQECCSCFGGGDKTARVEEYDHVSDLTWRIQTGFMDSAGSSDEQEALRRSKFATESVFAVCVVTPHRIDMHGFQLWLEGLSAEAADRRISHFSYLSSPDPALRYRDVEDQWRTYQDLEYYLQSPNLLGGQSLFQIKIEQEEELLRRYWGFDERLGRYLMGQKVTSDRDPVEFESIVQQHQLPLRSCERMYRNLRHVLKQMEGNHNPLDENQSVQEFLERNYRLDSVMAHEYTQVIFSCYHRINISTKSLKKLDFQTMMVLMNVITSSWTVTPGCLAIDEVFAANLNATRKSIKDKLFDKALERFRCDKYF